MEKVQSDLMVISSDFTDENMIMYLYLLRSYTYFSLIIIMTIITFSLDDFLIDSLTRTNSTSHMDNEDN